MKLLTKELEKNFEKYPLYSQEEKGLDAEVIAKFYNPYGHGTLLITEGEKQEDGEKIYSMDELETRKTALKEFNSSNKEDFEDNFSPEHYSIVLIDFEDEEDIYNIDEIDETYHLILNEFNKFLKKNKRKGALVPHFFQHDRVPHLHLIYQKQESNEFVNHLYKVFGVEE